LELKAALTRGENRAISGSKLVNQCKYFKNMVAVENYGE